MRNSVVYPSGEGSKPFHYTVGVRDWDLVAGQGGGETYRSVRMGFQGADTGVEKRRDHSAISTFLWTRLPPAPDQCKIASGGAAWNP